MTETANDPQRSEEITQENVNDIILSDQKRHKIKTIIETLKETFYDKTNKPYK